MRYISLSFLSCLVFAVFAVFAKGDVISLWNFNDALPGAIGGEQEFLVDYGTGTMTSNFLTANIRNTTGSTVNGQMGDPAGQSLLLSGKNNNGGSLTWTVDTTGFSAINISFATRRTDTGFDCNQLLYSVDSGLSWTSFASSYEPDTDFGLLSFDLGGIDALNNNPGAWFQIVFDGAASTSGNNRIDNLAVTGIPFSLPPATPVPETSTLAFMTLGLIGISWKGIKNKRFSRYRVNSSDRKTAFDERVIDRI